MQIPECQEEFPVLGVLSNSHFSIISILGPMLYLLLNPLVSACRYMGFLKYSNPPWG